jgi:hypothetical protein
MSNNIDDQEHEFDDCPTCNQRKFEEDELTKETLLIAPPHIKQLYEHRIKGDFRLIRVERTPEEKQRDEEERIKLGEFYKQRKAEKERMLATGEQKHTDVGELDLEARLWEANDKRIKAERAGEQQQQQQSAPVSTPVTKQTSSGGAKAKKPRGTKPGKKQPVKLGTITNPILGPEMDCDD